MADEVTLTVPATPPVGIENLKKAIKLGIDLGQQINTSFKDGYQWTDLFSFVDELSQAPGIIKSGAQVYAELKNLDEAEREELNTYVIENFDIPNDRVEAIIEHSLAIVFSLVSLIGELKPAA